MVSRSLQFVLFLSYPLMRTQILPQDKQTGEKATIDSNITIRLFDFRFRKFRMETVLRQAEAATACRYRLTDWVRKRHFRYTW